MSSGVDSVAALLREGAAGLGGDAPRLEAELLLGHVLSRDRAWLFAHAGDALDAASRRHFLELIALRRTGHPIAHLIGRRGFWSLELTVDASTLIPRPETELLVELALACWPMDSDGEALDMGTGSGAIALALGKERPSQRVLAVDASAAALRVAQRNAHDHGIANAVFRESDWFSAIGDEERFACIVSNPPYIAEDDPHLEQGDLRFEPRSALASGVDGLHDIRRIIARSPSHLQPGGWLLLEHGFDQGEAVRALLSARGFREVRTAQDWEARDRVSLGCWRA